MQTLFWKYVKNELFFCESVQECWTNFGTGSVFEPKRWFLSPRASNVRLHGTSLVLNELYGHDFNFISVPCGKFMYNGLRLRKF